MQDWEMWYNRQSVTQGNPGLDPGLNKPVIKDILGRGALENFNVGWY
jgi:hypothetical protein